MCCSPLCVMRATLICVVQTKGMFSKNSWLSSNFGRDHLKQSLGMLITLSSVSYWNLHIFHCVKVSAVSGVVRQKKDNVHMTVVFSRKCPLELWVWAEALPAQSKSEAQEHCCSVHLLCRQSPVSFTVIQGVFLWKYVPRMRFTGSQKNLGQISQMCWSAG